MPVLILPIFDRRWRLSHHLDRDLHRYSVETPTADISVRIDGGKSHSGPCWTYLIFRLGDLVVRDQLANAFSGRLGAFSIEVELGDVFPLVILARASSAPGPQR